MIITTADMTDALGFNFCATAPSLDIEWRYCSTSVYLATALNGRPLASLLLHLLSLCCCLLNLLCVYVDRKKKKDAYPPAPLYEACVGVNWGQFYWQLAIH